MVARVPASSRLVRSSGSAETRHLVECARTRPIAFGQDELLVRFKIRAWPESAANTTSAFGDREQALRKVDEYRRAAEFRLALNRFLGTSDNAVRAVGLTPQRYLMLLAIKGSRGGGLTISDLADLLGSAQSTVTELVDRREAAGLVRRGGSNDDGWWS